MVKGVFDELGRPAAEAAASPSASSTTSPTCRSRADRRLPRADRRTVSAVFFGLGSDGTVGANKNSVKIIGEHTDDYAQGYFVYDSRKSGSVTVSHLRFGPERDPLDLPHRAGGLRRRPPVRPAGEDEDPRLRQAGCGTFLLNSPYPARRGAGRTCRSRCRQQIIDKKLRFYVIDAVKLARRSASARASTRSCSPASSTCPGCCRTDAGDPARSRRRWRTPTASAGAPSSSATSPPSTAAIAELVEVDGARCTVSGDIHRMPPLPDAAPRLRPAGHRADARRRGRPAAGQRDAGRRHLADRAPPAGRSARSPRTSPIWDPSICIDCGKCAIVCPHTAIRIKVFPADSSPTPRRASSPRSTTPATCPATC